MEEEYLKYLIKKLFSDPEDNYENEILAYKEFVSSYNTQMKGEKTDERIDESCTGD